MFDSYCTDYTNECRTFLCAVISFLLLHRPRETGPLLRGLVSGKPPDNGIMVGEKLQARMHTWRPGIKNGVKRAAVLSTVYYL